MLMRTARRDHVFGSEFYDLKFQTCVCFHFELLLCSFCVYVIEILLSCPTVLNECAAYVDEILFFGIVFVIIDHGVYIAHRADLDPVAVNGDLKGLVKVCRADVRYLNI